MKNPFKRILRDVNMAAGIIAFDGPLDAAEQIVEELQDAGPSWSGRYSNSWEIEANGNISRGNGNKGNPRRIKSPRFNQSKMKKNCKKLVGNSSSKYYKFFYLIRDMLKMNL